VLEAMRRGAFATAPVVVMGGFTQLLPAGYPAWGPEMDYNVQADRVAARVVFERLAPVVVPVEITMQTGLRESDVPSLQAGGPLARLMALQAGMYADDAGVRQLARSHHALRYDLLNFQHDPLACAVAIGWDCATVSDVELAPAERDGQLVLEPAAGGPVRRLVTAVDARAFEGRWLEAVRAL
jgi:inosine-uridine nucleoside N-ribohydrolase